jgi:hypothetical protein
MKETSILWNSTTEIRKSNARVAEQLSAWANDFAYDQILHLVQEARDMQHP